MSGDPLAPVRGSHHLDVLDVEVARLAERATAAVIDDAVVTQARDRTVVATLQLDGSPLTEVPADLDLTAPQPVTASTSEPCPNGETRRGGNTSSWYTSFQLLEDTPDEDILRLEVLGAAAAHTADDLVDDLANDPVAALAELHRRLTVGLVDPRVAGQPRVTEQAVHDASIGRILYYTTTPEAIAAELDQLSAWLTGPARELTGLRAAGLLHLELLRIHPFEAANGRLARAAARLWLRGAGLDPDGLAVAEGALARQRLAYHEEVASTLRRREATPWLERWGDAVADGLRESLRAADRLDHRLPVRPRAFLDLHASGSAFTVADYRAHCDGDRPAADDELALLLDTGEVVREPGSRGLRYLVT